MPSYLLKMSPLEAVHILEAEAESAHGEPELNAWARKEYLIEEDFDRAAYGLNDGEEFNLVSSVATLNIEPRVERNYWVLETTCSRMLGPLPASDESSFAHFDMTPAEFETELATPGRKQTSVRLNVETPLAKRHFDDWLAEMRRRHPEAAEVQPTTKEETMTSESETRQSSASEEPADTTRWIFGAREAVAVFSDQKALETAVDELEISGFDRSAISVLGLGPEAKAWVEPFYQKVEDVEDRDVPRAAFTSRDSRVEGEAAAVALPSYIGGMAGTWAVVAAGGALASAVAAAIAGGVIGAGLGALLAGAIAGRYSDQIREQIDKGGIVLWVSVADAEAEKRALDILEKTGGTQVHAHAIQREWSVRKTALTIPQVDPFLLEREPPIED